MRVKKQEEREILKKLQGRLWSYPAENLDVERDRDYIVTQILNYGTWEDVKLLYELYSEEEIKEVVSNPGRGLWFDKALNFWTMMLDVELPEEVYNKALIDYTNTGQVEFDQAPSGKK